MSEEYVGKLVYDGNAPIPTLDMSQPIVRCRDCRYYDEIIHACDHPCVTPLRGDCPENWIFSCFDNDFCAWGKRKEVDA